MNFRSVKCCLDKIGVLFIMFIIGFILLVGILVDVFRVNIIVIFFWLLNGMWMCMFGFNLGLCSSCLIL